jgi:GDP-D-mannose 3',5'-epimerase
MSRNILVAGAGGFIGGWLVNELSKDVSNKILCVDIKPITEWHQVFSGTQNLVADLKNPEICLETTNDIEQIYNLAADMGGMGFIENNKALCMLSVLINTNLLVAAKANKVEKYFFASSACVYSSYAQTKPNNLGLKESEAYPADPEDGYGWEKLFSERMCRHFYEDFGIETRVARFHNVYGPNGTWNGGREKAPAAICRKVAEAKITGKHEIEIWGDGKQTRSFTFIKDAIMGINLLMNSEIREPINIGSSELVDLNKLVDLVEEIAQISNLKRTYNLNAPRGVMGRNSDNSKIQSLLNWEPKVELRNGLTETFEWVYNQIQREKSVI